jgi:hypothetical protein
MKDSMKGKTMNIVSRRLMMALGLLLLASGAIPGARAAESESPLGSPAASAALYTSDYAAAVQAALPRVDAETLTRIVSEAEAAAAAEAPLAIASVADLERFFGFRPSGQETPAPSQFVDIGDAAYRVDPGQRIYLVRRYPGVPALSRAAAARNLPEIQSAHAELAARLGIPAQGVHFADFREVLSQTDGSPTLEGGVEGEIESEGAVTTFLRAVGGVQVEGSYLRIASIDPSRLELVDGRWPAVRLSRQVATSGLRAPRDAADGIVRKVEADSGGLPVALHMAVVLRPVEGKELEFVPSLKIGLEPKSIETEEGLRTDAGEIFYVDLLRDSAPLADLPAKTDTPGAER